MTIFCDSPRAYVCDVCGVAKLVLDRKIVTTVDQDAAMRIAGWVEYAPRFVAKLFGGARHATQLHACTRCVVLLAQKQQRLRETSIDSEGYLKDAGDRLRRAERELEKERNREPQGTEQGRPRTSPQGRGSGL